MKKMMMALALCLMSAAMMANNRRMVTSLPADVPSVTLTIEGKQHVVKPTKALVREVDEKHVECVVYAGNDKALVTLPIAYHALLEIGLRAAETARKLNLITEEQWEQIFLEYSRQIGTGVQSK